MESRLTDAAGCRSTTTTQIRPGGRENPWGKGRGVLTGYGNRLMSDYEVTLVNDNSKSVGYLICSVVYELTNARSVRDLLSHAFLVSLVHPCCVNLSLQAGVLRPVQGPRREYA
jgi:hypothetical protein